MSLCPDCYIDEHLGHPKKRLEEVYNVTMKRIDEHYDLFKENKEKALRDKIRTADAEITKLSTYEVEESKLNVYTDLLKKAVRN